MTWPKMDQNHHFDPAKALETSGLHDFDTSIFVVIVSSKGPTIQRSWTLESPLPEEWTSIAFLFVFPSIHQVNTDSLFGFEEIYASVC